MHIKSVAASAPEKTEKRLGREQRNFDFICNVEFILFKNIQSKYFPKEIAKLCRVVFNCLFFSSKVVGKL